MKYSATLWPVHLKPKTGELFSSWLRRLAIAHGTTTQFLLSFIGMQGPLYYADIDCNINSSINKVLAERTGTSSPAILATTLRVYEGRLYEQHKNSTKTAWVLPLNATTSIGGLQFCQLCLAEDREPYFRKVWRLALITLCPEHRILLSNNCPVCGSNVYLHRWGQIDEENSFPFLITECSACAFDLRNSVAEFSHRQVYPFELEIQNMLVTILAEGSIKVSKDETIKSVTFFTALRNLMRLMLTSRFPNKWMRDIVNQQYGSYLLALRPINKAKIIEHLGTRDRLNLISMALFLFDDWPHKFIEFCRKYEFAYSSLQSPSNKYSLGKEFNNVVNQCMRGNLTMNKALPYGINKHLRDHFTQDMLFTGNLSANALEERKTILAKRPLIIFHIFIKILQRRSLKATLKKVFLRLKDEQLLRLRGLNINGG